MELDLNKVHYPVIRISKADDSYEINRMLYSIIRRKCLKTDSAHIFLQSIEYLDQTKQLHLKLENGELMKVLRKECHIGDDRYIAYFDITREVDNLMGILSQCIVNTHGSSVLTDSNGKIIHSNPKVNSLRKLLEIHKYQFYSYPDDIQLDFEDLPTILTINHKRKCKNVIIKLVPNDSPMDIRYTLTNSVPIYNDGHVFIGTHTSVIDITSSIVADKNFHEYEKCQTINRLAFGMAHNFNNTLTGIQGCLEHVKRGDYDFDPDVKCYLDAMLDLINNGRQTVKRLYDLGKDNCFTRFEQGNTINNENLQIVPLNRLIAKCLQFMIPSLPPHIKLEYQEVKLEKDTDSYSNSSTFNTDEISLYNIDCQVCLSHDNLPSINQFPVSDNFYIKAIPSQIESCFINMIMNSIEAINTQSNPDSSKYSSILFRIYLSNDRSKICIEISDNGKGVSPDKQHKIFHPFVSEKSGSYHLGCGLTDVKQTITTLGGTVELISVCNPTKFLIVLPSVVPDNLDLYTHNNVLPKSLLSPLSSQNKITRKIVLIESGFSKNIITLILNHLDCNNVHLEVETYDNPHTFLNKIIDKDEGNIPAIVISNYHNIYLRGDAFYLKMKTILEKLCPPFFILTGDCSTELGDQLTQMGISKVIRKPIERRILEDSIQEYIRI